VCDTVDFVKKMLYNNAENVKIKTTKAVFDPKLPEARG
jgi:hypothetical protein